ncbi:ABC transporter substrate-binding protein [Falsiroseomonas oryzae]|uniref:ABC transporter substrate-binding protein n=1 Tax=Falsiroseomonas oryzae TaxID=2766473 RepID=UPI0022EAD13C|nr:ABC transporter substrate-binding protein [Roseomonas sp. MO-31]
MSRDAQDARRRSMAALFHEAAERADAFDPCTDWEARGGGGARRRSFLALALASGVASLGGAARAQGRVPFRMDEINAVHYLATHFVEANLPRDAGVDWRLVRVGSVGHARVSAFTRGDLDAFATGWNYLATIELRDLRGQAVCGIGGGGSRLLARRGSGIRTLADLRGKRVGVNELNSQDIMLIYALRGIGIDAMREVRRVPIANPAGIIAAMARGDIDATATFEPSASVILAQQGATMITDLTAESFGKSHGGLYIRDAFVRDHPRETEAIVRATVRAIDFVNANKEAYIEKTMQVTGQSREIATLAVENVSPSWMMPMGTIKAICKAVHELGLEDRDVSPVIEARVNYGFLERVTGKPKSELGHAA